MSDIEIYTSLDNKIEIEVTLDKDTVWLNRQQLGSLFNRDVKTIGKHITNVFSEGELNKVATVANFATVQTEGTRTIERQVEYYNLDVIISVGYRVKSKQGRQFRQWASQRLKDYLLKGYAINEQKLKTSQQQLNDLKQSLRLLGNMVQQSQLNNEEAIGLLKVVTDFSHALDLLDQYDHQRLSIPEVQEITINKLKYEEAIQQIQIWRDKHKAGKLFGNEKDESFKSSLETIYQTFDGIDLYPSIKEKAANILYFVVKNHSFSDGNKRIAAGLFLYFLDKNKQLYSPDGIKTIADNTLVASA